MDEDWRRLSEAAKALGGIDVADLRHAARIAETLDSEALRQAREVARRQLPPIDPRVVEEVRAATDRLIPELDLRAVEEVRRQAAVLAPAIDPETIAWAQHLAEEIAPQIDIGAMARADHLVETIEPVIDADVIAEADRLLSSEPSGGMASSPSGERVGEHRPSLSHNDSEALEGELAELRAIVEQGVDGEDPEWPLGSLAVFLVAIGLALHVGPAEAVGSALTVLRLCTALVGHYDQESPTFHGTVILTPVALATIAFLRSSAR